MPTILRATCIGSLAIQALVNADSQPSVQVLNSFANSFYLRSGQDELVFVTNRPLQSAITINLDTTFNLDRLVKPMDLVRTRRNEVRIGSDVFIDLSTASPYRDQPILVRPLSTGLSRLTTSLRIASFILGVIDTSSSVLDESGLAHDRVAHFAHDGILSLRRSKTGGRFREDALNIVGLGPGFTPSGDDTLGGFLATYNCLAPVLHRSQILFDLAVLRKRTSWISAKLLDYLQRGILDEQMRHLIDSSIMGDGDSVILALESLLPRGHTSGIDISVGVILALSLVRDIAFQGEDTGTIATALGF